MQYSPQHDLLKQRIIMVTGASEGIGRAAALTYARYGAKVLLLGRNPEKLAAVKQEMDSFASETAECYCLDFSTATPADCRHLAGTVAERHPRLDGLLHNAGTLGAILPLEQTPASQWQQVMKINLNITFYLTQALLPLLKQSTSGSLVFTTSSVGRAGRAGWGAYAVSKFATEGMMQVFADELKDTTLRTNCINPGATRTNMRASAYPQEDPVQLKTPEEIMPIYLWLMGKESAGESGRSFDAQPGRKAGPAR